MTLTNIIRRVRFKPYTNGPSFTLTVWDTKRIHYGKHKLGYCLRSNRKTIFQGEDFGCSPLHAIDSDTTIASIMNFLTLRPGDTDAEYFADYTPAQLEFCQQHAEALASEVSYRFGDE